MGQHSLSKPEKSLLSTLMLPLDLKDGNSLLHLDVALWPTNPHNFLVAGMSHAQQVNAPRMKICLRAWLGQGINTPDHSCFSSSALNRNSLLAWAP